jgi:hypothetical protein
MVSLTLHDGILYFYQPLMLWRFTITSFRLLLARTLLGHTPLGHFV